MQGGQADKFQQTPQVGAGAAQAHGAAEALGRQLQSCDRINVAQIWTGADDEADRSLDAGVHEHHDDYDRGPRLVSFHMLLTL